MWFIGLEFKKNTTGGINITITYEIQVFSNAGQFVPLLLPFVMSVYIYCIYLSAYGACVLTAALDFQC